MKELSYTNDEIRYFGCFGRENKSQQRNIEKRTEDIRIENKNGDTNVGSPGAGCI